MSITMSDDNQRAQSSAELQEEKEKLFLRAAHGEISGDEADAEAIRLGLGRLSHKPYPHEWRAEDLAQWTLPMAVAWIAYRNFDEVREWHAAYRENSWGWIWRRWRAGPDGPVHEGWHLEQRNPPSLALLALGEAFDRADDDKSLVMSVRDAREALWAALQEGFFVASGVDLETNRRVEVPSLDWHELVSVQGTGQIDEVRIGLMGTGYRDVLLPSAALQGYWRLASEKPLKLPETRAPTGEGYTPLYCVAQWIATKGDTVQFDPDDETVWRAAYNELLAALASEKVRVVGTRNGQREVLSGFHFAGCQVDYPFGSADLEVLAGEDLYLRSYPYLDDEHWRGGFDDALINRHEERWTRLMVEKGDVRARWPFPVPQGGDEAKCQSGLPGRPAKSKHLIEDEFRRRALSHELADTLAMEAKALLDWLKSDHPQYPRPTIRTIENFIRADYRRIKPTK